MTLLLLAVAIMAVSGLPSLGCRLRSQRGPWLSAILLVTGSVLGLFGVAGALRAAAPPTLEFQWSLPLGHFSLAVDALSAAFLLPVLIVPALGALYATAYWQHPASKRRVCVFYGLLASSMTLIVIAKSTVLFLIAWEGMAISAYFLATALDDNPDVCRAGLVYLICTHVGTLCLIACFLLLQQGTGSFEFAAAQRARLEDGHLVAILVLALVGFGFKAGIVPLHIWLPGAHANAPSHVSAVMSGVMLKMGVYGLLRVGSLLPELPPWFGSALIAMGAASAVLGIAYAVVQSDLKRLLAYSSIENIGVIFLGVGLAFLGRSRGEPTWVALGIGGAVFHVWSHSLMKSLLFAGAGAVLHATGTRDLDRLGGLGRRMPQTMGLMVVGALAICALPPLTGFASELLLYLGLFSAGCLEGSASVPLAGLAAAALAATGALAVAAFVKVIGFVFLGTPRTQSAAAAHEVPLAMRAPMFVTAAGVVVLGLAPQPALQLLDRVAAIFSPTAGHGEATLSSLVPAGWISVIGASLVGVAALLAWLGTSRAAVARAETWGCGYAAPSPRIQYTATSFSELLLGLVAWAVRPARNRPRIEGSLLRDAPADRPHFGIGLSDAVLDRAVTPLFRQVGSFLPWLRLLQHGRTQTYVLYIVGIVALLLLWEWR